MDLVLVTEQRFYRFPDGSVWATACPQSFWERYLSAFDRVRVVARLGERDSVPEGWQRSDVPGVSFIRVPHFQGPAQYLARRREVIRVALGAVSGPDALIMRVPSTLANAVTRFRIGSGRPYGLEVVGDPHDVFAPGAVDHPARLFFRWRFARQLRTQCRHAAAVAYVTSGRLQERYPAGPSTFTTWFSSGELSAADLVPAPRGPLPPSAVPSLITVASMEQLYKGVDLLIDAVALLKARGVAFTLRVVGEGRYRPSLEERARRLGLAGEIAFVGQVRQGEGVRSELDAADLFVLASRTEGLPRAMIEAMGRGLPCIGTAVGGIPELLHPGDLVPANDAGALAEAIRRVLADPSRLAAMSARNLERAGQYGEAVMYARREAFYLAVKEATARRAAAGGPA